MWFEDVQRGRLGCGKPFLLLGGTRTKKKINTEKRLSSPYRKAKLKRFPLKNTQEIHFLGKVIEFFFFQSEEFLAYSLKQTKWESSPQVGTTWYRPPTLPLLVSTFSSTFTKAVGLVGQQCLSGWVTIAGRMRKNVKKRAFNVPRGPFCCTGKKLSPSWPWCLVSKVKPRQE